MASFIDVRILPLLVLHRIKIPAHNMSHFFFNDTATTEIYTLSLHDALPIYLRSRRGGGRRLVPPPAALLPAGQADRLRAPGVGDRKSVVEGKSVDLGGRRIIKKKKKEEPR